VLVGVAFGVIAASGAGASTGREEGRRIAAGHPDWTLPAWTRAGPTTWTMIGAPYAASVALVAADGRFAPRNHGPAIDFWLYDRDRGQLLVPGEFAPALHLDDDFAPIVTTEWNMTDLKVDVTLFAGFQVET